MEDECIIGKVPALQESEIEIIFDDWGITEEHPCSWIQFREGLNKWIWRMQDREKLEKMKDNFYALAQKYKM